MSGEMKRGAWANVGLYENRKTGRLDSKRNEVVVLRLQEEIQPLLITLPEFVRSSPMSYHIANSAWLLVMYMLRINDSQYLGAMRVSLPPLRRRCHQRDAERLMTPGINRFMPGESRLLSQKFVGTSTAQVLQTK